VLTGSKEFVYQPLTVLEPYQPGATLHLAWSQLAAELGVAHIAGSLDAVDPDARQITSEEQGQIDYGKRSCSAGHGAAGPRRRRA
jgi:NADH dehydrogenase FAD-containing subunit